MDNEIKSQPCIKCKEKPVFIQKRGLCQTCYGAERKKVGSFINPDTHNYCKPSDISHNNKRELEFVKNYFKHSNWIHSPAIFHLDGENYSPDFYDGEKNLFIEVSGTRQAYHANKEKYILMRKLFPKINFEIRKVDGTILDEDPHCKDW